MAESITISSSEFGSRPFSDILQEVAKPADLEFRIDTPLPLDSVRVAMLLAAAAKVDRGLSVVFNRTPTKAILDSLDRSLLSPIIWGSDRPSSISLRAPDLVRPSRAIVDPRTNTICVHTSHFPLGSRTSFQAELERLARGAAIHLPRSVYGAVATVAFETVCNAEEYGAYTRVDTEPPTALRYLVARLHVAAPMAVTASAATYVDAYLEGGHSSSTRWLELMVVDAGVGLPFPAYYVLATSQGWSNVDVFLATFDEEALRMNRVLNTKESTKGTWGRIVNSETARGEGTQFIMVRLSTVRGYVSVYSGRTKAEWSYTRSTRDQRDIAKFPPYRVSQELTSAFRGTIWHTLVPLDPQLTLPLGDP